MDYMELSDNLNEQLSKARGERDIAIKHMVDLEYQVCRLREELQKNEASLSEIFSRTYGPFKQKISQWLQAEQDGRLVVLPCKVGDKAWFIRKFAKNRCITQREVDCVNIDYSGNVFVSSRRISGGYIGKTVFLTREEAEAAMAQEGGDV